LTVLEERIDLVVRSQELLEHQPDPGPQLDLRQLLINDHMRTLLAAEHEWLKRTIVQLQSRTTWPV
jgi:hypothetical protein